MTQKEKYEAALRGVGGTESVPKSGVSRSAVRHVIPTGVDVLDHWVLGCGGLPGGRLVEMYSDPGAGKSSLGYQCLAQAQRGGGMAFLIETERSLLPERPRDVFGVDMGKLVLYEPRTAEDVLNGIREAMEVMPKTGPPSLIVWDSLVSAELASQKTFGDRTGIGGRARLMSDALPQLKRLAAERHCAVLIINQTRTNIRAGFGDPTTTPGGVAPKFYSDIRLQMWRAAAVKEGNETLGQHITIKATKNRVAIPQRKARLRLYFTGGFDNTWSLMDWAKEHGHLPARASAKSAKNLKIAREALGLEESDG